MAVVREPDDTFRSQPSDVALIHGAGSDAPPDHMTPVPPRPSRFDEELQPDLELTEGPASSGRVVAYAVAALLIVGAVMYGMVHTSTTETTSGSAPAPASSTTAANTPAPPPPVRNVTPGPNTQPGTTTGAAPSTPTPTAPAPAPAAPGAGTTR